MEEGGKLLVDLDTVVESVAETLYPSPILGVLGSVFKDPG